jgi:hypothetical protein
VLNFHGGEPEQELRSARFSHSLCGPGVKIAPISFDLFGHLEDLVRIELKAHNLPPSLVFNKKVNPFSWKDFMIAPVGSEKNDCQPKWGGSHRYALPGPATAYGLLHE